MIFPDKTMYLSPSGSGNRYDAAKLKYGHKIEQEGLPAFLANAKQINHSCNDIYYK